MSRKRKASSERSHSPRLGTADATSSKRLCTLSDERQYYEQVKDPTCALWLEGISPTHFWPRDWRLSTVRKSLEECVRQHLRDKLRMRRRIVVKCNIHKNVSPVSSCKASLQFEDRSIAHKFVGLGKVQWEGRQLTIVPWEEKAKQTVAALKNSTDYENARVLPSRSSARIDKTSKIYDRVEEQSFHLETSNRDSQEAATERQATQPDTTSSSHGHHLVAGENLLAELDQQQFSPVMKEFLGKDRMPKFQAPVRRASVGYLPIDAHMNGGCFDADVLPDVKESYERSPGETASVSVQNASFDVSNPIGSLKHDQAAGGGPGSQLSENERRLIKHLKVLQKQNQKNEKEMFAMEQNLVLLQQENETLKTLPDSTAIAEGANTAMKMEHDRLKAENDVLKSALAKVEEAHKKEMLSSSEKYDSLMERFDALKKENSRLSAAFDDNCKLETELSTLSNDKEVLTKTVKSLQMTVGIYKSKLTAAERQIQYLQRKNENAEHRASEHKKQMGISESEKGELNLKLVGAENLLQEYKTKLAHEEKRYHEAKQSFNSKCESIEKKCENQISSFKHQLDEQSNDKKKLEAMTEHTKNLRTSASKAHSEIETLKEDKKNVLKLFSDAHADSARMPKQPVS